MVTVSVFELFRIGIGPSSSHTVGPMRAARRYVTSLVTDGLLDQVTRVQAQLFGSLGMTGHGHGSQNAVLWGLEGADPESVNTTTAPLRAAEIKRTRRLRLADRREIGFDPDEDVILHRRRSLPFHPNGMTFTAYAGDQPLGERTYYSIGGGFVIDTDASRQPRVVPDSTEVPYPFRTGAELMESCAGNGLRIWQVMQQCIRTGCTTSGVLPGRLGVRRRAADHYAQLMAASFPSSMPANGKPAHSESDPLQARDWGTLWALAVNEENASGGRVVTAPTNGAAGIIPAVLNYAVTFVPGVDDDAVVRFLLVAGALGAIYQQTASISGAEVGCQGEVGTACSMAAGALAEILGGSADQVENAAEIGMEHNLGLTCDPVGGLVQIPCIERNAVGSVQAITAARLALQGDGTHNVSLDEVIKTMVETGADMKIKYKETSRGGLAVNIVEC